MAVHYTAVHGRETAHEIDRLGGDGLKVADGTVSHLDRAGRKVSIKTADGSKAPGECGEAGAQTRTGASETGGSAAPLGCETAARGSETGTEASVGRETSAKQRWRKTAPE